MTTDRILAIKERLIAAFDPAALEVVDESHKHVGHAGAKDGRGHFAVTIVSARFAGRKALERHRMVYEALDALMHTDIHALSVRAAATDNELQN